MELKIDNNKLEVKYIIGNYRDLKGYPSPKDIMYSILQWMISENKEKYIIFSENLVSKLVDLDQEKTKEYLEILVNKGYLEHVKDTNTKSIYKVIINPFI